MSKVLKWALVIFIIYYLATDPVGAAGFAHHALNGLQKAANSMSTFVSNL